MNKREFLFLLAVLCCQPAWSLFPSRTGDRTAVLKRYAMKNGSGRDQVLYTYPRQPLEPGGVCRVTLRFRDHLKSGSGLILSPTFYGEEGNLLPGKGQDIRHLTRGSDAHVWSEFTACWPIPERAQALTLSLVLPDGYQVKADLEMPPPETVGGEEGAVLAKRLGKGRDIPLPDPSRIRAIAASLLPGPRVPGGRPGDRLLWERLAALPEGRKAIVRGEALSTLPIPEVIDEHYLDFTRNGNRTRYEGPYHRRISSLQHLLIAECLEYRGRFIPLIIRYMEAICRERTWVMPAHDYRLRNFKGELVTIDLGAVHRGSTLAFDLNWLGERLPAPLRQRVESEVYRRVLLPYRESLYRDQRGRIWWTKANTNWNAVCHSSIVQCALALIDDPMICAEYIAAAERLNRYYISGFTDDGYCSEGMGYWNYGFGHEVRMGLAILGATGGRINLLTGEKIRKIAAYATHFQLQPDCTPWFADGGGNPDPVILALMGQLWPELAPQARKAPSLLAGDIRSISLRAFGQEAPPTQDRKEAALPPRSWFPSAQVLLCRPGAGEKRPPLSIAIKGGHNNENHNHNDLGSYSLFLDGVEMSGDPGGEIYTSRTFSSARYKSKVLNSYGHPVPVVNGRLQPPGGSFRARVLETRFTPDEERLSLDLTRGYAVKSLKSLVRTLVFNRVEQTVTITDCFAFSEPGTLSVPFITYSEVESSPQKGSFCLHREGRCLEAAFEVRGGSWKIERERIGNPGRPSPERVAATLAEPVSEGRVILRYRVKGKGPLQQALANGNRGSAGETPDE